MRHEYIKNLCKLVLRLLILIVLAVSCKVKTEKDILIESFTDGWHSGFNAGIHEAKKKVLTRDYVKVYSKDSFEFENTIKLIIE